eukprot:TRINITY_DN16976_c0_g2_i1.p1 TRINITY_DN16976_c0_g2~~TRINITY_DN16976_c0_g2_i1.p1  ORF type:complete len:351 (+),score=66.85 TRINITY_DN16976_c0_g2_i1:48-1055(+)
MGLRLHLATMSLAVIAAGQMSTPAPDTQTPVAPILETASPGRRTPPLTVTPALVPEPMRATYFGVSVAPTTAHFGLVFRNPEVQKMLQGEGTDAMALLRRVRRGMLAVGSSVSPTRLIVFRVGMLDEHGRVPVEETGCRTFTVQGNEAVARDELAAGRRRGHGVLWATVGRGKDLFVEAELLGKSEQHMEEMKYDLNTVDTSESDDPALLTLRLNDGIFQPYTDQASLPAFMFIIAGFGGAFAVAFTIYKTATPARRPIALSDMSQLENTITMQGSLHHSASSYIPVTPADVHLSPTLSHPGSAMHPRTPGDISLLSVMSRQDSAFTDTLSQTRV